jgi:hypothetical protein
VINFSISKEGNKFKATLEWGKKKTREQFMGKLIRCTIVEG